MKQLYILVLSLAALLASPAAQAQFFLEAVSGVTSPNPDSIRTGTFTGTPANDYGFGDPDRILPIQGEVVRALPDTMSCVGANIGTYTGKIVVVHRGNCLWGEKLLRAQQSGAIGVIMINNPLTPLINNGGGPSAPSVTIPVALVGRTYFYQTLKPALAAGTVVMRMGGSFGRYANNLKMAPGSVVRPPLSHRPWFLTVDSGDVSFKPGARVFNYGSNTQSNVKLLATISRIQPDPALIYADSLQVATLTAGDTIQTDSTQQAALLRDFDLVSTLSNAPPESRKGLYEVVYTATSEGVTDDLPADNRFSFRFRISDSTYTTVPLGETPGQRDFLLPNTVTWNAVASPNNWSWGIPLNTHDPTIAGSVFAKRITFSVGLNTSDPSINDSLAGNSISLELLEWNDTDSNGAAANDDTELTLVGSGVYDLSSNAESQRWLSVDLLDAVNQTSGVLLAPNKRYIVRQNTEGTTSSIYFAGTFNSDNYEAWMRSQGAFSVLPSIEWPNFLWAGGTLNSNRFAGFSAPGLRVDMIYNLNALKPAQALTMRLFPNPAQNHVQLSIAGATGAKAQITITDFTGRTVHTEQRMLEGSVSHHHLSTAGMLPGIYTVHVKTAAGNKAARLVLN